MSFNVINVEGDAPILYGERILFKQKNVKTTFSGSYPAYIKGSYDGKLFVTTTLIAFVRKTSNHDVLTSFSALQRNIKSMDIGQPLFGCNYLKLKIIPEPGGGAIGDITVKMEFFDGGTYECYKAIQANMRNLTGVVGADSSSYARTTIPKPPTCPEYSSESNIINVPPDYATNPQCRVPPTYDPNPQYRIPPNLNPNPQYQMPPNFNLNTENAIPPEYDPNIQYRDPPNYYPDIQDPSTTRDPNVKYRGPPQYHQ